MTQTQIKKSAILSAIDALFSDTTADPQEHAEALEEIKERCDENASALIEMINNQAR